MALLIRCDECKKENGVNAFGGAPSGWCVSGFEHFCSAVCEMMHDRRKQPRHGPVITARAESDRCICDCAYGEHAVKLPHRCLDCGKCDGFEFGRHSGERKLSGHDVEEIRDALLIGASVLEVAKRFSVTKTTIEDIRKGRRVA
jgi:hypothetical protein